MKRARLPVILTALIPLLLAGCAPHDVNEDPNPLIGAQGAYSMVSPGAPVVTPWYRTLGDPKLNALVEDALTHNMDVLQAMARLKQAEALSVQSRSTLFPSVNGSASSSKQWADGEGQETENGAGVALSWEIDAFGRLSSAAAADRLEERASAEDIEAVRLGISAEVAEAYFGAVAQRLQIVLLQNQTEVDNHLLNLITQRFEAGVGANVEVLQQKSQLAENQSLIPPAEAALRVYENRLDVLTGQAPDGADRTEKDDVFARIGTLPAIGIPSDLLLNRPDLRALKNRLIASDEEIAAAIADRMPRITLDGTHLFSDGAISPVSSVLASLVQPLLDWGQRRAEVSRNKAVYEEDLAAFTKAYLEAVEDVENALYQEARQREFVEKLEIRQDVLNQSLKVAETTYREGESDYMPVLDAVQNLRAVERNIIGQRMNLVLQRVQLYRALGGPVAPPVQEIKKED